MLDISQTVYYHNEWLDESIPEYGNYTFKAVILKVKG